MKRGQVSIEYMVVVAFAFLMIMPVLIIFLVQSNEIQDNINVNQANNVARKISHFADSVYYLGYPSKTTIRTYIPRNVDAITIGNREVVFTMHTTYGPVDVVYLTNVNVTGSIKTGTGVRSIQIKAETGYVNITD